MIIQPAGFSVAFTRSVAEKRLQGLFDRRLCMEEKALVNFVTSRFSELADPAKAGPMASYLKTDMPFYGIQKPQRVPVFREMKHRFKPWSQDEYEKGVLALWALPHREEKYAALEYAQQYAKFINRDSILLYEHLIRVGAWWDLVDGIATILVGRVFQNEREFVSPLMEKWIDDEDFWIRRTAIIAQLKHREQTDYKQLFDFCLRRASETEFFIRKAIGWALREYSKTSPARVQTFLLENKDVLSGLSFREGSKHMVRTGFITV